MISPGWQSRGITTMDMSPGDLIRCRINARVIDIAVDRKTGCVGIGEPTGCWMPPHEPDHIGTMPVIENHEGQSDGGAQARKITSDAVTDSIDLDDAIPAVRLLMRAVFRAPTVLKLLGSYTQNPSKSIREHAHILGFPIASWMPEHASGNECSQQPKIPTAAMDEAMFGDLDGDADDSCPHFEKAIALILRMALREEGCLKVLASYVENPSKSIREHAAILGMPKSTIDDTMARITQLLPGVERLLRETTKASMGQKARRKREAEACKP